MVVQFQGAFSDNLLKWMVTFAILASTVPAALRQRLVVLTIPLLFAAPFLLLSLLGGYLADRFSKRQVTLGTKLLELGVAGLAVGGLFSASLPVQLLSIALFGAQAALFGPTKYALLPELLPPERLSWGNGLLELGTFVAIITGTMAAGLCAQYGARGLRLGGTSLVLLACLGLWAARAIPWLPPANRQRRFRLNPFGELLIQSRPVRSDPLLLFAVLGNTYFWFFGAFVLINLALYASDRLHLPSGSIGLLMALLSTGIGVGSLTAGYLSGKRIEYGLVPLGVLGVTVGCVLLARPSTGRATAFVLTAALGFSGGLFAVPLNALIQARPRPEEKGGVVALANWLSFVGITAQPIAQYLLLETNHPDPAQMFLYAGLATVGLALVTFVVFPPVFWRLLGWLLTHTLWQVHVEGQRLLRPEGAIVLTDAHLGWRELLLLTMAADGLVVRWHPDRAPFSDAERLAQAAGRALARKAIVCLPVASLPAGQSGRADVPVVTAHFERADRRWRPWLRLEPA